VSAKASGYMKALVECPNGERITPREKLVGMVLADSHQDRAKRYTYPSVDTIAEDSLSDRRTCQRYLAALERKGVILRMRPPNQGRGAQIFYFFSALDEIPEGWQDAALLGAGLFAQKGGGRAAEGRRKGGNLPARPIERAQEREQEQQKQQEQVLTPLPPSQANGECEIDKELEDADKTKSSPTSVATNYVSIASGVTLQDRVVSGAQSSDGNTGYPQGAILVGGASENQRLCEAAVDQVMSGLAITKRRMRAKLRAVIALEADKGASPPTTALAMMAAWRNQCERHAEGQLSRKFGIVNFFELGIWKDANRWMWDTAECKLQAGARVGSM
jgi:hypothetical protein